MIRSLILPLVLALSLAASPSRAGDHAPAGGATSWEALELMKAGNKRFVEGRAQHPNQDPRTRAGLAAGQKPHTIVLSCSDSRVPPEIVFDQGLGQVFTIRTAGHVLDAPSIASIEYALEHLGATLIVVMGHESCGAVKAALGTPVGKSAGSPSLDALVAAIRPAIAGRAPASDDRKLREPVKANTSATARALVEKSKIIRDRVNSGKLMIAQAIYGLESGKVEFWDVGDIGQPAGH